MFTTKYFLSKQISTFSDSEELHLIKWRLLVCWCVSEIRNCNYNCENLAVPLGTRRGWAARYQVTGDTDAALPAETATLVQIDK